MLHDGLQVDLRVLPEESYGAALIYFTGSKDHCVHIRRLAQRMELSLNEYGLFRGTESIAGRTEEEVYRALGLDWIAPELREDRGEIKAAMDHTLPRLIARERSSRRPAFAFHLHRRARIDRRDGACGGCGRPRISRRHRSFAAARDGYRPRSETAARTVARDRGRSVARQGEAVARHRGRHPRRWRARPARRHSRRARIGWSRRCITNSVNHPRR